MHGVGFFNFSQNETERREQQETLRKAREETTKNQDFAARLKVRREELMKRRIIAARKRKRQRMGLSDMEETDQYCTLRGRVRNISNFFFIMAAESLVCLR